MVKRLATSPHDPLGITDSACKNQSVMVSVQYSPFNSNIPIRSTIIGKSIVARDPITSIHLGDQIVTSHVLLVELLGSGTSIHVTGVANVDYSRYPIELGHVGPNGECFGRGTELVMNFVASTCPGCSLHTSSRIAGVGFVTY
ncbi:Myb family transcription factor [Dorcoceras hygrometricum]|uniref:Myb family transcription factor n=1 Tax=Dorcoceras hygrometricum TaxID=472368 RepID=A0A2Z7B3K3_9LAMI|nr:Myb family transcription factor [Dorcoceras hygrometricum]